MHDWDRFKSFVMFLSFIFSPGLIAAIVLIETIYWTSPELAQKIGFPTHEGYKTDAIVNCQRFLSSTCKTEVVHESSVPLVPAGLPEWTPIRVEQRFLSGLAVVSILGPHENFQYIVRDFTLSVGETFRIVNGVVMRI